MTMGWQGSYQNHLRFSFFFLCFSTGFLAGGVPDGVGVGVEVSGVGRTRG